jgi:hypothetical protein
MHRHTSATHIRHCTVAVSPIEHKTSILVCLCVEAPIMPACTTASAAVARGIIAMPNTRGTPAKRPIMAMVIVPRRAGVSSKILCSKTLCN